MIHRYSIGVILAVAIACALLLMAAVPRGGATRPFADTYLELRRAWAGADRHHAILFQVFDGRRPIVDLAADDLVVREDGVSVAAPVLRHVSKSFTTWVDVMIDVTGGNPARLRQAKSRAISFIRSLFVAGNRSWSPPRVALYTFDCGARPALLHRYSGDGDSLERAITSYSPSTYRVCGLDVTNLYGTVALRIVALDSLVARSPGAAGALVVVTDGRDEAGMLSRVAMLRTIGASRSAIFTLGAGSALERPVLEAIGRDGSSESSIGRRSIEEIATHVRQIARSCYLLEYDSWSGNGPHTVSVAVAAGRSVPLVVPFNTRQITDAAGKGKKDRFMTERLR